MPLCGDVTNINASEFARECRRQRLWVAEADKTMEGRDETTCWERAPHHSASLDKGSATSIVWHILMSMALMARSAS